MSLNQLGNLINHTNVLIIYGICAGGLKDKMALLGTEYASSDEENLPSISYDSKTTSTTAVIAAPEVSLDVWSYLLSLLNAHANIM